MSATTINLNDRGDLTKLRAAIQAALRAENIGFDVEAKLGSCRYEADGDSCRFTLTISKKGAASTEAKDFTALATTYGLKPEHLGMTFQVNGTTYQIAGLRLRAPKKPILCHRTNDHQLFVFPDRVVARQLELEGK